MNIKNLIIIFVKVGYFKSGVRVGINHQETLVSLWEAHPQGVSAEAEWLLLPPVLTCHHVIRILGQCFHCRVRLHREITESLTSIQSTSGSFTLFWLCTTIQMSQQALASCRLLKVCFVGEEEVVRRAGLGSSLYLFLKLTELEGILKCHLESSTHRFWEVTSLSIVLGQWEGKLHSPINQSKAVPRWVHRGWGGGLQNWGMMKESSSSLCWYHLSL